MASDNVDRGTFIFGVVGGAILGGVLTLLYAPISGAALRREVRSGAENAEKSVRSTVSAALPSDPVADSIAEGKAAARRRRDELLGR